MVVHSPRALSRRLSRLDPSQRLVRSRKPRSDLHFPRPNVRRGLTFAERRIRKATWETSQKSIRSDMNAVREEIRSLAHLMAEKHGKNDDYWYTRIFQSHRRPKAERKTSRWNAYVSIRLKQINASKLSSLVTTLPYVPISTYHVAEFSDSPFSSGLPAGQARKRANDADVLALLSREWAVMSEEERAAATDTRVKEIKEDKETRLTGENNAGISAFHDAAGVMRLVENEVRRDVCEN